MITVKVTDRAMSAIPNYPVTSGSVGLPAKFIFSDAWDGLTKIAVFKGSGTAKDVALLTNECVVPAEVLEEYGDLLWIGVYGANGDGDRVTPTIWCKVGIIEEGTEPSESDPADPTPNWVAQVQAAAASALEKAEAVEAAAAAGDYDGYSPAVTITEITGGHSVKITDADHTSGQTFNVMDGTDGEDGTDGVSPTLSSSSITGGHRITIVDASGTTTVDVMDGEDGSDGEDGVSPTISVSEITGGHRVTITDANGTTTVDVMDGEDGATGETGATGATGNGIASISKTGSSGLVDTYTITYTNGNTTTFTVTNGEDGDDGVVVRGTGTNSAVMVNEDYPNTSSGHASFATGSSTTASGSSAFATGTNSIASGERSFAGGNKSSEVDYPTTASGNDSFAFGLSAKATGQLAVAFGQKTEATGNMSFVTGNTSSASGNSTFAAGQHAEAKAAMSVALGNYTKSNGRACLVAGQYNVEDTSEVDTSHGSGARKYILIVGNGTADNARSNAMTVDWDGNVVVGGKMTVGSAPVNNMDVATKKYVDDNAGGGGTTELYWCTYGTTASADIETAYQAGKICAAIYNGQVYFLTVRVSSTEHKFSSAHIEYNGSYFNQLKCSSNTWTNTYNPLIPSTSTPAALGTAAAGTSGNYARADHVHAMPSASDVGAAPAITEVTVSTAGAVTQALDPGKIYHFTGALTSLTITLTAAASGQIAQYHFDFDCGSTAPTVTIPNTVTMPDGNTFAASTHYEVDILNNYGVVASWATS